MQMQHGYSNLELFVELQNIQSMRRLYVRNEKYMKFGIETFQCKVDITQMVVVRE